MCIYRFIERERERKSERFANDASDAARDTFLHARDVQHLVKKLHKKSILENDHHQRRIGEIESIKRSKNASAKRARQSEKRRWEILRSSAQKLSCCVTDIISKRVHASIF